MARPKTGVDAATETRIADAIERMRNDESIEQSKAGLAKEAGVGRATIYRCFEQRPMLAAAFASLGQPKVRIARAGDAQRIRELEAENRELRRLLDATATTVEALLRDNDALRKSSYPPREVS